MTDNAHIEHNGFTVEIRRDGVLVEGDSTPNILSKAYHDAGQCVGECGFCYAEACAELQSFVADRLRIPTSN
jgi:hypothetical protein